MASAIAGSAMACMGTLKPRARVLGQDTAVGLGVLRAERRAFEPHVDLGVVGPRHEHRAQRSEQRRTVSG